MDRPRGLSSGWLHQVPAHSRHARERLNGRSQVAAHQANRSAALLQHRGQARADEREAAINMDIRDLPPDRRIERLGGTTLVNPGIQTRLRTLQQCSVASAAISGSQTSPTQFTAIPPASPTSRQTDSRWARVRSTAMTGPPRDMRKVIVRPLPRPPPVLIVAERALVICSFDSHARRDRCPWTLAEVVRCPDNGPP